MLATLASFVETHPTVFPLVVIGAVAVILAMLVISLLSTRT
jgi:hypothetical protein